MAKLPTVTVYPMSLIMLGLAPMYIREVGNKITIVGTGGKSRTVNKKSLPADFRDHPENLLNLLQE